MARDGGSEWKEKKKKKECKSKEKRETENQINYENNMFIISRLERNNIKATYFLVNLNFTSLLPAVLFIHLHRFVGQFSRCRESSSKYQTNRSEELNSNVSFQKSGPNHNPKTLL